LAKSFSKSYNIRDNNQAAEAPMKSRGKWKRLAISCVGVFIVFASFIVKDVQRDTYKDLLDSIDSAENAFLIRMEDRKLFNEIKGFEAEFEEFRKHPTTPVRDGGSSGSDTSFGDDDDLDYRLRILPTMKWPQP
jgi:hypothetical protein